MDRSEYSSADVNYGYRQGKDDGIQSEREKIVAWLRGETGYAWSRDVIEACDSIEAGEHLK